ncbi:hypothetical protein OG216_45395 [Streptomycetaceae bacterium NBC_01309]
MTGAHGLTQAAGIAAWWIRKGIADRVEVFRGHRLVLVVTGFDVEVIDAPRRQDTYRIRTVDSGLVVPSGNQASHLADALAAAEEQLMSSDAPTAVEICRGGITVARVTRAELGSITARFLPRRTVRERPGRNGAESDGLS